MRLIALLAAAILLAVPASAAQQCAPIAEARRIVDYLAQKHGERLVFVGNVSGGVRLFVYANPSTGTWSLIATDAEKICLASSGEGFRPPKPEDSPVPPSI